MSTIVRRVALLVGLAGIVGIALGYYVWDTKKSQSSTYIETTTIIYERPKTIKNIEEDYDVIVIGGEPEGVAAAVSAARSGAKTLLIENRKDLGGLFTIGMLNFLDIPQGEDGTSVSKGIFEEWHKMVGGQSAFGIEEAKAAFTKLVLDEENLTLAMNTEVTDVTIANNTITGLQAENEHGTYSISGESFIDATQDADFATLAEVPHYVGGEDVGMPDKKMAVTLVLHLKNVNWDGVRETAKSEKFGYAEVTESAAWGFSKLHFDYIPTEENVRLRGLNLAKVGDEYFINALQIFGIDGLSEDSKSKAIEIGKRETIHILEYLKSEFPGFENAEVASYPKELYVRETRHIEAEYQLPMSDIWTNKDHWDGIALGAYPVDIQAQTLQDYGVIVSDPIQYAIPFRSLVPKKIEGLLVVGRSAGYSSIAAGSARIVPTGMSTAEAAGVAAVLVQENDISFRELSQNEKLINELRARLTEQGAFLKRFEVGYPYQSEWFDLAIQRLINYGIVAGGYVNEMPVDNPVTNNGLLSLATRSIERINESNIEAVENARTITKNGYKQKDEELSKSEVLSIIGDYANLDLPISETSQLVEAGVISPETAKRIDEVEAMTYKEVYVILVNLVDYMDKQ